MSKHPISKSEYAWRKWIGRYMVTEEYKLTHDGQEPDSEQVEWLVVEALNEVFQIVEEQ